MACYVRLMRREDIAQVTAIDLEAFPSPWPPLNYRHELNNRMSHYIVVCDDEITASEPEAKAPQQEVSAGLMSRLKHLFSRNRNSDNGSSPAESQYILGFAGFWNMAGEAHIMNIAVREEHQRHGIGELLFLLLIDLAVEMKARLITLEVRASNTAAQSLYHKYGLLTVGSRRNYYRDTQEDGVIMTLENITSAPVKQNIKRLKQAHVKRWGISSYKIAR